jgi:hypothetical protein
MMKKIIYITYIFLMTFIGYSCKEQERLDQIDDSAPAPAPVTIVGTPIAKPGGAVIKYSVPVDKNLLGVKAVYVRNGETIETKASLYTDSLTLVGFGDTNTYDVNLYSVGRNGKLSVPVSVSVTPLTPPIYTIRTDMESSFGGVFVSISENSLNATFALVLLGDTAGNGQWIPLKTFYTSGNDMKYACRGLAAKEQRFALYARDRWNNYSDTIFRTLTPVEEVLIPKDRFSNARLPGDYYEVAENNNNYRFELLWDLNTSQSFYATPSSAPMPRHFTINLGRKVSISRFKLWHRTPNEMYSGSAVRTWELWGSDDPPGDGSWDNWYLLGKFSQIKPSGYGDGSAVGTITDDDREWFMSGGEHELQLSDEVPDPYRTISYIRLKVTSTFTTYGTDATIGQSIISELTFWGQLKNE